MHGHVPKDTSRGDGSIDNKKIKKCAREGLI